MGFSEDRAQGRFGERYLLYAANSYLLWDAVENWKATWQKQGKIPIESFQAPKIDLDRLLDIGATIPMFAETRLVVIRDVNRVTDTQVDRLVKVLSQFGPTTKTLVTASEIDKRKKWFKGLCAWGPFEEFPPIYPDKLPGWAQRIAGEFGWRLAPAAADLLASTYGDDLFAVRQTIERATLFVSTPRRIEVADIEPMLVGEGMHSVFLLLDAAAEPDLARSLAIIRGLFAGDDYPATWLSGLASLLTRLLKLLELNEPNDVTAAQLTGIKPFFIKKSRIQAKHFGRDGLVNGIRACFETECAIKTSRVTESTAWELLAWRLCTKTPMASFSLADLESSDFGE